MSLPSALLRVEGLALAAAAVAIYAREDLGWILFAATILAPDLSFAAYLAGPRVGAVGYDALHALVGPLALAGIGYLAGSDLALALGLVWTAHVGVDRALGYGLKYPTSFRDTHLQRL